MSTRGCIAGRSIGLWGDRRSRCTGAPAFFAAIVAHLLAYDSATHDCQISIPLELNAIGLMLQLSQLSQHCRSTTTKAPEKCMVVLCVLPRCKIRGNEVVFKLVQRTIELNPGKITQGRSDKGFGSGRWVVERLSDS
jgi:hypothetical protein